MDTSPVMIGIGPEPAGAALAYAVEVARRQCRPLRLVHVLPSVPPAPESILIQRADLELIGRETLDAAVERARDLAGEDGPPVAGELLVGHVVPTLVRSADRGSRMILEQRPHGRWERIVTRFVLSGVAARARVPVLSVPFGWAADPAGTRPVTVGIEDPERDRHVLTEALAEARERRLPLRVLHSWDLPVVYDDLITLPEHDRWVADSTAALRSALRAVGGPGEVPVDLAVERGRAADALLDAASRSELLVIGRHDRALPPGSHLGPVARAVLREAPCPVQLTSAGRTP